MPGGRKRQSAAYGPPKQKEGSAKVDF
jgi:hypothetical protein